jgi:Flp pilus assembly CpaE family ATPase
MKVPVLTAAGGATWEAHVVTAFERGDFGVHVSRRCVDVVDLLAVACAGEARAALVDADLRRLDPDAVDRLLAAQVPPVAVVPRGDQRVEDRMRAMGFRHLVPRDADAAVTATVVLDAISRSTAAESDAPPGPRSFADPMGSAALAATVPVDDAGCDTLRPPARAGSIVAVWGPVGAPGRTTVALALADELARLGASTLLVDADVYGGVIAGSLGLLEESPGLAAACRAAGTTRLDGVALAELCWQVSPRLRVLTGIALAQRWPEVRASAIGPVLTSARTLAEFTVVDCGFGLETDEEISFDSLAPRRNGATLAVLDAADVVLAVGACDPIGLQRLVRGLADLREAGVTGDVRVVLNKLRRGATGRDPAAQASAALDRFAGRGAAAILPYDLDALDAAALAGRTLGEMRPNSTLRQAVVGLARSVSGIESRSARRRQR